MVTFLPLDSRRRQVASRPERLITYDDYVTFPDSPRLEVIAGEAYVVPSPSTKHQRVILRLVKLIVDHLDEHGGGEVFIAPYDVVLTDMDIVQPDIVFIADADMGVLTEANVRGAPSWVIEVLSPSSAKRDVEVKRELYERAGVPEYWIVDPGAETVTVYRLNDGSYGPPEVHSGGQTAQPLAPAGFTLDPGDLFASR